MRRRSARLKGLAVAFFLPLLAASVFWVDSLAEGEDQLIQRRYEEAIVSLERALEEVPEALEDRVLLLLGRAYLLAGRAEEAVPVYQRLVREHPGSGLVHRARFQEADALIDSGRSREAAQIYRDEIERLTGLDRKEEVASTYLSLAEQALGQDPPDHSRAVTFYDLALDLGLSPEKSRAVRLIAGQSLLQIGRAAEAITRLEPLVEELQRGQGLLRAMLALGRARLMAGDRPGARRVLGDLRSLAPDAPESADAAYENALSYGVPQPSQADLDRAVTALQELGARYPEHQKAKVALYLAALCYQFRGRSQDALESLEQFLESHGDSGLEEVAAARALVGQVLAGQGRLEEAISAWRAYLTSHPSHAQWEYVQRAIVDTEYRRALEAYQSGEEGFELARELFDAFGRDHPLDARNPDILYLLGDMFLQEKEHDLARAAFARCVSKYPGKEASSHAQFAIGEIYESVTFHYLDALKAYRAVTWGSWAGLARQRIARLERKSLSLLTPRIYNTAETPVLELTSRNIEKVRVRVYRLELEDYFRATHTAGQVERLDIEVIEPDRTFDDAVPEYQQYRETTREVDIDFREPGAYVVKVDDQELEATTMVLVSDLALIAKSSRHEFFVFSENTVENRVEGGVKVVLSDGEKVVAEGVTGPDGVWRYKGEELKSSDDLRVFAVNAAGSGASSLDLSGMGYSTGLSAKGYLFTDRPVYQPGQAVHIKGIVREVADGLYQLPREEGYRVQVHSAAGRLILQRPVSFTSFGSFAVDLVLPAEADLGPWRLLVDRGDVEGEVFTSTFQVARYERPRLSLTADLEEPVVFRGERIEGRFQLEYFFGEPAVGKEVAYSLFLPDGSTIERRGETNAAGEVPFSFETVEFGEEALALIRATVPAENAATQIVVPVVTTEFVPTLSTVRSVYLAGETFHIDVAIEDRSGEPLAREASAVLLRLESSQPRAGLQQRSVPVVEVEVERKDVTTDGEGSGRVSFEAEEGGSYRVRVEARDRFDNLVTGDLALMVSGDDDEVKLRLLSDRQSYKVGETVRVKVANRATDRLVLETVQGDGILAYRSYLLPRGEGELELTLQPLHAPNFSLSLAMVDGDRLHSAEREFRVTRDLQVEVTPDKELAAPGEELEVTVTTTDPQGRPVSAEVALSMVDESLLSLYAETAPPMGAFFYGTLRETAFRTVSSCTWSYRGEAGYVSAAILAEERRLEEAIEGLRAGEVLAETEEEPLPQTVGGEFDTQYFARSGLRRAEQSQQQMQQQRAFDARDMAGALMDRAAGGRRGGRGGAAGPSNEEVRLRNVLADKLSSEVDGFLGSKLPFDLGSGGLAALALNEPRTNFSETGAWISSVVTDGEGNARVKIEMPHSTTAWRIRARAVTADTYVGEGTGGLRTAVDLQADLLLPQVLTEGDETEVGARVHNLTERDMDVGVELVLRRGDEESRESRSVEVGAHREAEPRMAVTAEEAVNLELALTARSGDLTDEIRRTVPVQSFGMEFRTGRSGTVRQEDAFELSLPGGREYSRLELLLEIGPEPGRDLVSAALGLGYRPANSRVVDRTNLGKASRGVSALLVLDDLERRGGSNASDRTQLVGLLQAVMAALQTHQEEDGGLSWAGRKRSDRRSTAQAVRFLGGARRRGLPAAEETANRAAEWLLQQLRTARTEDRPDLLWALASVDRARFESLNSLHRVRHDLSPDGMARLALAWQAMERPALAGEVLDVLRPALVLRATDPATVTTVALGARALLQADPTDALGVRAVEWLRSVRRGASWGTPEATAAALGALTAARREAASTARAGEIGLFVNDHEVATIPPESAGRTASFSVPSEWLQEQGNMVRLQVKGAAEVYYSATMTGFARGFRREELRSDLVSIQRRYLADFLRHDDRDLQPGFSVVQGRNIRTFENQITQLQVGQTGRVRVQFWMPSDIYRERLMPLVVEEPIPAGCSVPRESIRGSYDHVVVEPHRLLFFYGEGRSSDVIQYEVQARFPGSYRALPTRAYGALRPDLLAYGDPATLRIHERGSGEADPYRLTPDELYNLGKGLFDGGQLEEAGQRFDQLLAEWHGKDWSLRQDIFREVARMMLYVSVSRGDARNVARFFEELKDRHPDLVIPFDKILEVGKAYLDLGEFEAALLVFRATAESSFLKEAAVATTLEGLGEINASVLFLQDLLPAYPDLNTIRVSHYSIGQRLAALAAAIPDGAVVDLKVGGREELRTRALEAFREFLVLYTEDPLAEEVSFAWATTYLEAKNLERALQVAEASLLRYPGSTFEDEFLYSAGYARFALGEPGLAFAALERVADGEFLLPRGGRGPSENRYHAIYLQGQIHHALGEPAQALSDYEQVEDHFTDAVEAADYFLRKQLSLPEVVSFALDEEPLITITYRNIERLDVQVFRVDLMRLYLLEKSLNDIQGIQLHGIRPYREMELSLGDGRDYRSMEREITVELPEPGAYLVVARGGDLLASGMVLRSDLKIEAQETHDVGRIRVNVKQGESFLADAHVKVIGSGDGDFRSGDTDLRGIYVADQLIGRATVIVKKEDQYAFYRGEEIHQPARYRPPQTAQRMMEQAEVEESQRKRFDALEYNMLQNDGNRGRQIDWLRREVLNQNQQGVEVYRTKR